MARAFVIGVGDGSTTAALSKQGFEVSTVAFEGENWDGVPGQIYFANAVESAGLVVSRAYGAHANVVRIPDTVFYDTHPVDPKVKPLRDAFALEFYTLAARRPYDMGDDIIDGIQGGYNLALSAKHLLRSPMPDEWLRCDYPAICIGSGPSLSSHLAEIRALQGKALIIACDSALDPLVDAGVIPTLVTPLERVPETLTELFTKDRYHGVIFAGNPVVHPDICAKFDRCLFLPGTDILFSWAGAPTAHQMWFGQSTGTLGVALAMRMTSGPIYLVGHDLAFAGGKSHFDGVHANVQVQADQTSQIAGNDGSQVTTQYWWDIFRRELGDMAASRPLININAHHKVGAVIPNALAAPLPQPEILPDMVLPEFPVIGDARYEAFKARVKALPADCRSILAKLSTTATASSDSVDMRLLCKTENRVFFSYILRSVFAQFSMDLHAGMDESLIFPAMIEAMQNSLRQCLDMFRVMAEEV